MTAASPAFLKRSGTPRRPSDLAEMACLIFLGQATPFEWRYMDRVSGGVTVPVAGGYRADICPLEISGDLTAKAVRNARLIVYEGGAHGLVHTQKDRLNADLLTFLGS